MSETALRAAAWLLTYALHSTLLMGAAALLARRVRGEAWRDTLWKAALVGGLVTATAHSVSGYSSPAGTWQLHRAAEPSAAAAFKAPPARPAPAAVPAAEAALASASAASTEAADASTRLSASPAAPVGASASTVGPSIGGRALASLAVAVWAVVAALLVVRIGWRQGRLWRMLRGRREVEDEALVGMLAGLRRSAGLWRPVRLTTCGAAPTPLALGRREVCVPPRFLTDLDPEQQRTALAHELAHLARRDPAWHFAIGLIEAVFFFQPLNRLARLRLRESAEFLCDEWAARQTGSPLGLARCLAEVASWVAPGRSPIPAGTMAMAEGGSPLVQRVQRLTTWRGAAREGSGAVRIAAAALLVLAVAFAAPAVASSAERAAEPGAVAGEPPLEVSEVVAIQTPAQDSIIRHPRPSDPLARRWEWAVAEVARRRLDRAWIAYSVPTSLPSGERWSTDSHDTPVADRGREPLNRRLGAPADDALIFFAVAADGEVERVAGRLASGFGVGRRSFVWLGRADGDESFAHLRRLADGMRDPQLRESLVDAAGVHRGPGVVPYLAAVLGRDGSDGVRREAAQALGRHPGEEALAALVAAIERDGSAEVRREAVESIGMMRHPESVALLREIAVAAPDADTRRHAIEALGLGGADAFESLRLIATGEQDQAVSRQAVESMESFPAEQAAPVLAQIAWQPDRDVVARQAAESLGRFPAAWTLAALDSIARTHPRTWVARQAVESLARYPDAEAERALRGIAERHRDPGVREEARDQLRRREARQGSGGAPAAPDAEHEISRESASDPGGTRPHRPGG